MHVRRDGFALVTILLIVVVVGILTTGSLLLSVSNLRLSRNDATSTQALAVAQAGSAYWRAELVSLYVHMVENFEDYEDDVAAYIAAGNQITCGNYLAIGVDTNRDGTPDVAQGQPLPALTVPFGVDGAEGSSTVTFSTRGSAIVLDSRGSFGGARARVVDEFSVSTVDVWNNAVFAGNSAANATIQGRAEIRGSVHVLGEGLSRDDMALDITGSFGLGNTYKKVSDSLKLPTMQLTTLDPHDLCATVRVKRGYVLMDGSAQIGYAEESQTDQYVDNVSGIYTNDGIRGGTIGENVFSLNGMNAAYDAGNSFRFPDLDAINPQTDRTWRHGLQERALVLSADDDDDRRNPAIKRASDAQNGDVYLTDGCFSANLFDSDATGLLGPVFRLELWNNTKGTPDFACAKRVKRDPLDGDLTLSEVRWTRSSNELYVGGTAGVINFRGADLLITGSNATDKQIGYKGEGILFAERQVGSTDGPGGNVVLEVDFLPFNGDAAVMDANGGYAGTTSVPNTYPATAIVAVVADKKLTSQGAQKRFTTAIYAQQSVSVTKQALVAGSIVTRTFDAGSEVPTVLYVPNLAERLSDLMPGTGSQTYAVSNVAYSRR